MTFTPTTTHTISQDETGNSTKTLLASSATFTGAWENVIKFSTVAIAIKGDNVTDGTLYIESSQDGGTTANSVPYTIADATFDLPHIWNVVETHIRVRYTNGSTTQTGHFQIQTKYSNGQQLGLLQGAGDTINTTTDVQVVKSITTGTNPNGEYKNNTVGGVDDNNSSTANLGVSATFTGTWSDISSYHGITVLVDGTSAGTSDGTLFMEFSHDGVSVNRSISIVVASVVSVEPRTLGVVAQYFRIRYINGTTAMTSFDVQTMFHEEQVSLVSRLDQQLSGTGDVANVRSVVVGQQPSGSYRNDPANGQAFTTSVVLNPAGTNVFTSNWIDTHGYNVIEAFIKTNVISANDGIVFEFTDDLTGTPSAQFSDTFTFSSIEVAAGFVNINVQPKMVGFRLVYTNGGTIQGSFLLQVDLKINGTISARLDAVLTGKEDVTNVRSVVVGEQPGGTFRNDPANGQAFSTSATLGSGGVFTSDWIDTHGYNVIEAFVCTDEISADDGIVFEFTNDLVGTPTAKFTDTFTFGLVEQAEGFVNLNVQPKMVGFRIVYTNGVTAQGLFLLQVDLKVNGSISARLDAVLTGKEDVTNVRSVVVGEQPGGTFRNDPANGQAFTTSVVLNPAGTNVFTSDWIDTHGYNVIEAFISTNVLSAVDGVEFQFTDDLTGTPTARFSDTFTFSSVEVAAGFVNINVQPKMVGFRLVYTNGGTIQGSFLLQVDLKINGNISARLDAVLTGKEDATNVRSVVVGEQPSGTFRNDPANGQAFSTSATLGSAGAFTSDWIDTHGYNVIEAFISTNVLSAVNGIVFEFTDDLSGTPTAQFSDTFTFSSIEVAAGFVNINVQPKMVGFRLVYTNGGTIQGSFLLQVDLKVNGSISARLDAVLTGKEDVTNVRSVVVGETPNGTFLNQKIDGVAFRTEIPLTAGTTNVYTSPITSTEGFSQIETHLFADTAGALVGTWYNDESETTLIRSFTRPYSGDEVGTSSYFSAPVFGPYVKYVYTNTGGDQSAFFLDFHLRIKAISGQVLGMNDFIPSGVVANLGRNVVVGQQPGGNFKNNPHNGVAFTTSATLGIGAEYDSSTLSGWTDTDGFNAIELFISSDVISATSGIFVEFTDDLSGTPTVRETRHFTHGPIDLVRGFLEIVILPVLVGFRIRYVNGGIGQGSFILQVDLKINGNTNTYNEGGALIISESNTEIALGNVPNHTISEQFGVCDADIGSPERTIWPPANVNGVNLVARKTFATSTQLIYISSTSASDTIKDITMSLIDSTGALQVVTITLSGQTPVSTAITGLDCNSACLSSGSDLVGDVFIFLGGTATAGVPDDVTEILAYIDRLYGKTMQATYRVPLGERMIISNIYAAISRNNGGNGSASINLRVKPVNSSWNVEKPLLITNQHTINKSEEIIVEAGGLVEFTYLNISDNDTRCNAEFKYQLIKV